MKLWLSKCDSGNKGRIAGRNPDIFQQHGLVFTLKLYQTANQLISSDCPFDSKEQHLDLLLCQLDLREPAFH